MPLAGARLCVAYSGGGDSTALLAALAGVRARGGFALRALHVDHALQPGSARWARQARRVAHGFGVRCRVLRRPVDVAPGASVEASARTVRYAALAAALRPGEWLLLAHHAEDQAETLLLQLLRGAGLDGLAAMPVSGRLPRAARRGGRQPAGGDGDAPPQLLRPLLGQSRDALRGWLARQRLVWVEDPSNADTRFDRNYLRHELWPLLIRRWPAAAQTLARSAAHLAGARTRLQPLDAAWLVQARAGAELQLPVLRRLPPAERAALVRTWLAGRGAPPPDRTRLAQICGQLPQARADAQPLVRWAGWEVRRHGALLFAMPSMPAPQPWVGDWDRRHGRLTLPDGSRLWLQPSAHGALAVARLAPVLQIRWGMERTDPALKKLLQQAGVPPWQRARVPLILDDGRLIAAGDLWIAPGCRAAPDTAQRAHLRWLPPA